MNNAEIALDLSAKEVLRMGRISQEMLAEVETYLTTGKGKTGSSGLQEREETLDFLQTEITHYLSLIVSRNSLTERQSRLLANLMHLAGDLERIGDHCTNIREQGAYMEESQVAFSKLALADLQKVFALAKVMFTSALAALEKNDPALALRVLELESRMDVLEKEIRTNHLERLSIGFCNPKSAVIFNEIVLNVERIADHCNNVAEAVLEQCQAG